MAEWQSSLDFIFRGTSGKHYSLKQSHESFLKEDNKVIISPEKDFSDVVAQSQTLFPLEAKSQVPNGRNEITFHSKNIHQSPSVC